MSKKRLTEEFLHVAGVSRLDEGGNRPYVVGKKTGGPKSKQYKKAPAADLPGEEGAGGGNKQPYVVGKKTGGAKSKQYSKAPKADAEGGKRGHGGEKAYSVESKQCPNCRFNVAFCLCADTEIAEGKKFYCDGCDKWHAKDEDCEGGPSEKAGVDQEEWVSAILKYRKQKTPVVEGELLPDIDQAWLEYGDLSDTTFLEGRGYPVGTKRQWKGKEVVKTSDGWVEVPKDGTPEAQKSADTYTSLRAGRRDAVDRMMKWVATGKSDWSDFSDHDPKLVAMARETLADLQKQKKNGELPGGKYPWEAKSSGGGSMQDEFGKLGKKEQKRAKDIVVLYDKQAVSKALKASEAAMAAGRGSDPAMKRQHEMLTFLDKHFDALKQSVKDEKKGAEKADRETEFAKLDDDAKKTVNDELAKLKGKKPHEAEAHIEQKWRDAQKAANSESAAKNYSYHLMAKSQEKAYGYLFKHRKSLHAEANEGIEHLEPVLAEDHNAIETWQTVVEGRPATPIGTQVVWAKGTYVKTRAGWRRVKAGGKLGYKHTGASERYRARKGVPAGNPTAKFKSLGWAHPAFESIEETLAAFEDKTRDKIVKMETEFADVLAKKGFDAMLMHAYKVESKLGKQITAGALRGLLDSLSGKEKFRLQGYMDQLRKEGGW